ncbi:hypothetical protein NXS08_01795 [Gleimia sp. 6138-11-ORH1]|uniref:hypothetical protein n=1 Tax=Gleimia sp. 6138-11-ORH1 TaxID=2973937 RepID=UPI00216A86F6|nr:hypothetical protein [Gleimia sp. 6138-11-ORH1]MCS4484224.1 hypothetical protein [Gleimia sp. 6138-11-ORH1]
MKKAIITSLLLALSFSIGGCYSNSAEEPDLYAEYAVKNGEIVLGQGLENDGSVHGDDKIIWNKINRIIPKQYLQMVSKYKVETDGLDGVLASVNLNEDNKTWTISIDLDDTLDENKEFKGTSTLTVIHEMAHIVALNNSQTIETTGNAELYAVDEGTLRKDAYLSVFYDKFWKNQPVETMQDGAVMPNQIDKKKGLYNENPDAFITEYAASDPVEDFAESFAYFVILEKPTDNRLQSQKLSFFYDYPEFVQIRNDVRAKIDLHKVIKDSKAERQ